MKIPLAWQLLGALVTLAVWRFAAELAPESWRFWLGVGAGAHFMVLFLTDWKETEKRDTTCG